MRTNLLKEIVELGGAVQPLLVPANETQGLGLCNPSIFKDGDQILVNLRNVQYTLYHSEGDQKFQSRWGPLAYMHPENDPHLRTTNFLLTLDPITLEVKKYAKVDTSLLDVEPLWEFIGLEDARVVRWKNKLYLTGVRRDTTTNGVGRMELSEIIDAKEVARKRIEVPNPELNPYCEKNWMPITDMPYHYVKWTNPTEVVKVNPSTGASKQVALVKSDVPFTRDIRGGSQVIPYKGYHIALTHEVDLYFNYLGNKDANYYHRFIVWDKDWNIVHFSEEFTFFSGKIEFGCGLMDHNGELVVTTGFQDSSAYIVRIPYSFFDSFVLGNKEVVVSRRYNINPIIKELLDNPSRELANFNMGEWFFKQGHYASALSFFLRAAEGNIKDISYESMMKIGIILANLGGRPSSERCALVHAISIYPERPEAYLLMSFHYERTKEWYESMMFATIGQRLTANARPTFTDIGYPGAYMFKFQIAISSWWIGRDEDGRRLLRDLAQNHKNEMLYDHAMLVEQNLSAIGSGNDPFIRYDASMFERLRFKFNGSSSIVKNHSQVMQDLFVLSMLDGKRNGTYLEIGAADPYHGNNTAILEENFHWKGLSFEIKEDEVLKFANARKNPIVHANALEVDYSHLMEKYDFPHDVDYLQLDCEPPRVTYEILTKIPFDDYRFAVITFEHDNYVSVFSDYKRLSREFLRSKGYELVISNVAPVEGCDFEDWWIHPDLVDRKIVDLFKNDDDSIKVIDKVMLH